MKDTYDEIRQQYKPGRIKGLLIAESPPPGPNTESSRHFYRTDKVRAEDRLYVNTIRALYPETLEITVSELETQKKQWLQRLKADGWYMIEALEISLPHPVPKPERQLLIRNAIPRLIERVRQLADSNTKLLLIKSNVFDVASEPLRRAGFVVLNTELIDYPGRFNQRAYREKLSGLARQI
jgi:hypothetical protein